MSDKDKGNKGNSEGNYKSMTRVVDITAYKLEKMLEANSHDEWLHQALLDILGDYYMGLIAIGWEDGQPVVMPMRGAYQWKGGIPPGFSVMSHDAEQISERGLELDAETMEIVFTPEQPGDPEPPDDDSE